MISEQQSSTALPEQRPWARLSQTHWIFISIVVAALGYFFPDGPNAGSFRASNLEVLSALRANAEPDLEDLPSSTITTFPPLEGVTV